MASPHRFGGKWTEEKLGCLREYLNAYMGIFSRNVRASKLRTIYLDAFAGTGYRNLPAESKNQLGLFVLDEDAASFQKGSAWIALETEPSFNDYVFIDLDVEHVKELEQLRAQFPAMANRIHIVQREANGFLSNWCAQNDWRFSRAVVFLDPYGMSVDWTTLESIAQTRAIDLWLLFPLGQAVNRLLTRDGPPDQDMAARLTRIFGTDEWKEAFYRSVKQQTLFGPIETVVKMADFKAIGDFFVARLKKIFAGVASNPLPLYNSKNVPIYLLCFAAANPRGAPTAIKIAQHLLGTKSWQRKRK